MGEFMVALRENILEGGGSCGASSLRSHSEPVLQIEGQPKLTVLKCAISVRISF